MATISPMPMLDRRRFLHLSSAAAVASMLGGLSLPTDARALGAQDGSDQATRTLLVIEMEGGNDALNTFVPATGAYHDLRPTVGLADSELTTFAGMTYGVHPSLGALSRLWDAGQLTALYGTGLPEQSRSHFVAQDAWRSAQPGVPPTSGWLGRWLEAFPPEDDVALRAISLGQSTLAAQGETGRPVAVQSVEGYRLTPPGGNAAVTDAMLAMASPQELGLFGQAQAAIPTTVASVHGLQDLIANAAEAVDDYEPDPTSALFGAAQAIIQADVGTQVLYITVGGFDTHAGQRPRHEVLLETVSDGIANLFAGLEETGHSDRVLAMAVSEFGRRGAENASAGTDHGKGGLSFMVGPAVAESTVIGAPDLGDLDNGDLRVEIDARCMYDRALRWLGASSDDVAAVLGDTFTTHQILT